MDIPIHLLIHSQGTSPLPQAALTLDSIPFPYPPATMASAGNQS